VKHRVERVDQFLERRDCLGVGALGGEHRDPDLDRHPLVAHRAPVGEQLGRRRRRRRLRVGDERAPAATPRRVEMAALGERDERLAQRRARDPEPRAQFALSR
jgi:hypothetical protein